MGKLETVNNIFSQPFIHYSRDLRTFEWLKVFPFSTFQIFYVMPYFSHINSLVVGVIYFHYLISINEKSIFSHHMQVVILIWMVKLVTNIFIPFICSKPIDKKLIEFLCFSEWSWFYYNKYTYLVEIFEITQVVRQNLVTFQSWHNHLCHWKWDVM